jgi:hypothetical protein
MSADRPTGAEDRLLLAPDLTPSVPPLPLELSREEGVQVAARSIRHPSVVTKLRLLLRAHEAVSLATMQRRAFQVFLFFLALAVSAGLGVLAGLGTFHALHEDTESYTQKYNEYSFNPEYFVRGKKVSRQEYDYFLQTNSNSLKAQLQAVPVGLATFFLLFGVSSFLLVRSLRPVAPDGAPLESQIAAIVAAHPEAVHDWGGPAVLRQREMVEELLRIEEGPPPATPPQPGPELTARPAAASPSR